MQKPNHISLTLIAAFTIMISILILPTAATTTPKIYVNPPSLIDSTKTPGSKITININTADIPSPPEGDGLYAYQFYLNWNPNVLSKPVKPLSNMNFTETTSTAWVTSTSGTVGGTPSYGYDTSDGNPALGSDAPSYYVKANANATHKASMLILAEQSFSSTFGTPMAAQFSFAYKVSGNSFDNASTIGVRLIKPDASFSAWVATKAFSALKTGYNSWSYNMTGQTAADFTQPGTYRIQLRAFLKTLAVGTSNYVQVNWDDIGIKMAPITITEGPFLKQNGDATFFVAKYLNESQIYVANTIVGGTTGISGNGTLATVTFLVDQISNTTLRLDGTKLKSFSGVDYVHIVRDGWFDNTWSVKFTTWPDLPFSWENVSFNASSSVPKPGRSIMSYLWDFGDVSVGAGVVTEHFYGKSGLYVITLNVTDDLGLWGIHTEQIALIDEKTSVHELTAVGITFKITVRSNSTVSNVNFNDTLIPDQGIVNYTVTGPDGTAGFCNVTIPRDIMWGDWTVLLDGAYPPTTLVIASDQTNYYLYFTYTQSTHTVTIISTGVVPEFPPLAAMLLILLLVTLAGVIAGKNRIHKNPLGIPS